MRSKLYAYDIQFANEWNRLVNQTHQSKELKLVRKKMFRWKNSDEIINECNFNC